MSARINIGKMHQGDNHYRYTMPRLLTKIEGRGNGIKTVLVNMVDIASDLKRPVTYPTKYFGNVLGAQSKYDTKNDKAIVNGSHTALDLQRILQDGFIQKFVLCEKCTNPETVLKVTKNDDVTLTCMACGHVTRVDPTEKLCTFIINNPPEGQSEKNAQGGSASSSASSSSSSTNASANEQTGSKSAAADAAYAQSSRNKEQEDIANLRASSGFDEDDWSEDVSKEAVRRRRDAEGLAARVSEITADVSIGGGAADDHDSGKKKKKSSTKKQSSSSKSKTEDQTEQESPVVPVRKFLRENPTAPNAELHKVILKVKEDFKLRDKDVVYLVAEALLLEVPNEDLKTLHKVIGLRAPLLYACINNAGESGAKIMFGYLEKFATSGGNDALKLVPVLLQKLYLEDVLAKESIMQWRDAKKSRFSSLEEFSKIKDTCQKFFDWLATQEEDEEEEEEDDDE